MRVLILDDEPLNRENLRGLLQNHCPDVSDISECGSISEGLAAINTSTPDLLLLDIQLQEGTGFDMLQQIGTIHFEVIFITAYDQYAVKAIKYAALDYLLKPVDISELKQAIAKAKTKISEKKQNERMQFLLELLQKGKDTPARIALPLFHETLYVKVEEIIRCEASNTYTYVFLQSGEQVLVSQTLKEFSLMLEPKGFIRTHQSHLVNTAYIRSWLKEDGGQLMLKDKTKIPVSKLNREKVKEVLKRQ